MIDYRLNGSLIDLCDPRASLEDCGVHLAGIRRFAGIGTSVLDHSIVLAESFATTHPDHQFFRVASAMHDAPEAVTGDIPGPFRKYLASIQYPDGKNALSAIKEFEEKLEDQFLAWLGYPGEKIPEEVKQRDRLLRLVEKNLFGWLDPGDAIGAPLLDNDLLFARDRHLELLQSEHLPRVKLAIWNRLLWESPEPRPYSVRTWVPFTVPDYGTLFTISEREGYSGLDGSVEYLLKKGDRYYRARNRWGDIRKEATHVIYFGK